MNIYDVLRKLVEARQWQAHEQVEAIEIIEECRRLGVFGTAAGQIAEEHEHEWVRISAYRQRCMICTIERENQWQA